MPVYGAAVPAVDRRAQLAGGPSYVRVLLVVRAGAVAVLEVDAQVLDGLAGELVADAGQEVAVAVDQPQQQRLVLLGHPQRRGAVVGDEGRVEAVRGDVDGVHRLPPGPLARVVAGQRGVDRAEALVELVDEPGEVEAGPVALHDRHPSPTGAVQTGTRSVHRVLTARAARAP